MAGMTAAVPDPRLSSGRAQEERRHILPDQERLHFSFFILYTSTPAPEITRLLSLSCSRLCLQRKRCAKESPAQPEEASNSEMIPCS